MLFLEAKKEVMKLLIADSGGSINAAHIERET